MNTDKIKELVNDSDLVTFQKNRMIGFINKAETDELKKQEDRNLIEQISREQKLSQIILSTDEVKIYTVFGKDEWDIKYPFRSIYVDKKGIWRRCNTVSPTLDTAYLTYLQYKYLALNSQFVDFAIKMLEIKIED